MVAFLILSQPPIPIAAVARNCGSAVGHIELFFWAVQFGMTDVHAVLPVLSVLSFLVLRVTFDGP